VPTGLPFAWHLSVSGEYADRDFPILLALILFE